MNKDDILANKYLPVRNGVHFIASVKSMKMDNQDVMVVRSKEYIFLKNGKNYAVLTDRIMDHLNHIMQNNETIFAIFSYCAPEEYEIKKAFKVEWSKTECAKIIGFYSVFREQIIKEKEMGIAVNE